jgi:hypothetical protein
MPLFPTADRQQQQQHLHSNSSVPSYQQLQDNHQQQRQLQQQQPSRPASSSGTADRTAGQQQGDVQRVPLDVLLSPLLPSADESKLLDRLSQLRVALDEQHRLAASWEQQVSNMIKLVAVLAGCWLTVSDSVRWWKEQQQGFMAAVRAVCCP